MTKKVYPKGVWKLSIFNLLTKTKLIIIGKKLIKIVSNNIHTFTLISPTSTSPLGIINEHTYIIINDKIIGKRKYNAKYLTLFKRDNINSLFESLVAIKIFFLKNKERP